ncbi:hypothetical protein ACFLW3_01665, partial [Chloroflexota bacterium]
MATDLSLQSSLDKEAEHLAQMLFANKPGQSADFARTLLDIHRQVRGKEFLLIHNPGGYGNKSLDRCLKWERSAVTGVSDAIDQLEYTWVLTQHFRASSGCLGLIKNVKGLCRLSDRKVNIMVQKLQFIARHNPSLKIIMISISQGAAFSNAVMQRLNEFPQVYSIELGIFFLHKPQRVLGERTLAIDSNGTSPDAAYQGDILNIAKTYLTAPFRLLKYRLQGNPKTITYCVNVPGHNYDWSYPAVRLQIE